MGPELPRRLLQLIESPSLSEFQDLTSGLSIPPILGKERKDIGPQCGLVQYRAERHSSDGDQKRRSTISSFVR